MKTRAPRGPRALACESFEYQAARERGRLLAIDPSQLATEVNSGVPLSRSQRLAFPIGDGMPRTITFCAGVIEQFDAQCGQRLPCELPGFRLPTDRPMEGEKEVLRTFSSEWVGYDWDGETYWDLNAQTWFKSMDYVLEGTRGPSWARPQTEVVGMNLGYVVDVACQHFSSNLFLQIVDASEFKPPFADDTFDFVT